VVPPPLSSSLRSNRSYQCPQHSLHTAGSGSRFVKLCACGGWVGGPVLCAAVTRARVWWLLAAAACAESLLVASPCV